MITQSAALTDFYLSRSNRGEPLVLATIIETVGSTYRKAGAQMLIAPDGQAAGLLSGGCAEADLIERAQRVFKSGRAEIAEYDTRGSDDVIWGIGLGCEGAMRILLTRIDRDNAYQPFAFIEQSKSAQKRNAFALIFESTNPKLPLGFNWLPDDHSAPAELQKELQNVAMSDVVQTFQHDEAKILIVPIDLPSKLLLLGAGADAMPVVELAGLLGWQVTVADHRPAYAIAARFVRAREVLLLPAAELSNRIALNDFDAAVVMSHHLTTDQIYLAALADSNISYVGLLGPANRRARLLAEIGDKAKQLTSRLAGPVGLDIGAQTPEAIALAIIAEIHAHRQRRTGGSFSGLLPTHHTKNST